MQLTTTLQFACASCGRQLDAEPQFRDESGTVKVSVGACSTCAEHGAQRTMDTIETDDERVHFNGKTYGRREFAALIERMIAVMGFVRREHGRELMAPDSDRDERPGLEH